MPIRKADKNDLIQISELLTVLDCPAFAVSSHAVLLPEIEKGWHYLATDSDGTIIGSLALRINEGSYEIVTIATNKPGVGRQLVEFAVERCKSEKIPKLWCWSLARYNAEGFYKKMGFEERFLLKKQWFSEDCWYFGKNIEF